MKNRILSFKLIKKIIFVQLGILLFIGTTLSPLVHAQMTTSDLKAILAGTPGYEPNLSDECTTSTSTVTGNGIYVIGDSYAQGIEGALKPKLSELGYEVTGWNAVRGRSITSPGSDPSNAPQKGIDAIEADSDIIKKSGTMIVILGTNGVSSANITDFMNKARSYNPDIRTFWVNVNYPDGTADSINQRNKSISAQASELNYTVIDWYAASISNMSDYFGDPLHPNATGYKAITGLLESALKPFSSSGTSAVSSEISGSNNTDYAGNTILNKAQLDAIQENQPFYQSAADKVGIPWQMIAVIHLNEHGLQRSGPSNTDGPYQILGGGYKVGDYTDEEFQAATDKAAAFILNKAGGKDLASLENIKDTFFAYNGKGDRYIEQALKLGFSQEQANNGDGSAYVMNRSDAKRDPTIEPTKSNNTWGQYKNGGFEYPANTFYGAFVTYSAIANISSSGSCSSGSLSSGGMTLEQAKEFMKTYETSPDSESFLGSSPAVNSKGSVLGNCVAFSVYFINKFTTLKGFRGSIVGNGEETADNMAIRNPGVITGTEPKLYAVFSISSSVMPTVGHTGVILGIDTEKGIVITGEAHYSSGLIEATTHTLEEIKAQKWTFSYTDGYLKGL